MNDIMKSSVTSRFGSVQTQLVLSFGGFFSGFYRGNGSFFTYVTAGNGHCYVHHCTLHGGVTFLIPCKVVLQNAPTNSII